jgi:DNA-binding MarR family transcriptional regulator
MHEMVNEPQAVVESTCNPIQGLAHRVYDYITSHVRQGGKLNLSECARELMVERDDVVKAVEELREEGRIVLQKPGAPVK